MPIIDDQPSLQFAAAVLARLAAGGRLLTTVVTGQSRGLFSPIEQRIETHAAAPTDDQ